MSLSGRKGERFEETTMKITNRKRNCAKKKQKGLVGEKIGKDQRPSGLRG